MFDVVSDLTTYPHWLDIVAAATPVDDLDGSEAAWTVDLRGQMGPLRRSKRLRMVRTASVRPTEVRFERSETDGRRHSSWVMTSVIRPGGATCEVDVTLHYGGQLWIPLLDRLLADEIDRSRDRLRDYVENP